MRLVFIAISFFTPIAFSCVNLNGLYGQYSGPAFEIKQKKCETIEIFGREPGTNWNFGFKGDLPLDGKKYSASIDQDVYKLDLTGADGTVHFKAQFVDDSLELYMYMKVNETTENAKLYKFNKLTDTKLRYSVEGKNWVNQDYYQEYIVGRNYRDYLSNPDFSGKYQFTLIHSLSSQQQTTILDDLEYILDPNHYYLPMALSPNLEVCSTNSTPTGDYCTIEIEKHIGPGASLKNLNILKIRTEINLDEAVDEINRIHFDRHIGAIITPTACVNYRTKPGAGCVVLIK